MRRFARFQPEQRQGFTLVEIAIYLAVVAVLLAILLPALATGRRAGRQQECQGNQRQIGQAWLTYVEDRGGFPEVPLQPDWRYGGARFSAANTPYFDLDRPLNHYLAGSDVRLFRCPGDCGITDEHNHVGTGRRTVFRSFGTSYRANGSLLDARRSRLDTESRGMRRDEITVDASRLVIMGDAEWFEAHEQTGRNASWHGGPGGANLLFLDGSVKYQTVQPRHVGQPAVFNPVYRGGPAHSAPAYGPPSD